MYVIQSSEGFAHNEFNLILSQNKNKSNKSHLVLENRKSQNYILMNVFYPFKWMKFQLFKCVFGSTRKSFSFMLPLFSFGILRNDDKWLILMEILFFPAYFVSVLYNSI